MIRNLKVLGLALVAVLAVTAVTASAASAASFTSESAKTTVSASQVGVQKFIVTGLEVTCTTATFHGEIEGTSAAGVTMTPTYTGCTAKAGIFNVEAKVTGFGHYGEANKCDYFIRANGKGDLECPAGQEVTVDAGTCQVHIPSQTELGTITFTNGTSGGKGDITASLNLSSVTANHTDGIGCPFNGSGEQATGTLTGEATVTGTNAVGGAATGISWDA